MSRQFSVLLVRLAAVVLLAACTATAPPRAGSAAAPTLDTVDLIAVNLTEQRVSLQLRLRNPGDSALEITDITGTLYIADQEFAQGGARQPLAISGREAALIDIDLIGTVKRFRKQLRKWAKQDRLPYRLVGTITLADNPAPVPFEHRGEIDLERMLGQLLRRL